MNHARSGALASALIAAIALVASPAPAAADGRLLFVGNSFTYGNSLELIVEDLLEAGAPDWGDVEVARVASGGARLVDHLANATTSTQLRTMLVVNGPWDAVLFQEQSQIPGFPTGEPTLAASLNAAAQLADITRDNGSTPWFWMTWGYRNGDDLNPALFPDYPTMQDRLAAGYIEMTSRAAAGGDAWLAPVGLAWRVIWDAELDPLTTGSLFLQLHTSDQRHPAAAGSYLAACTIYASLTGTSPEGLNVAPGGLSTDVQLTLERAAWEVVSTDVAEGRREYPWTVTPPADDVADVGVDVGPDADAGFDAADAMDDIVDATDAADDIDADDVDDVEVIDDVEVVDDVVPDDTGAGEDAIDEDAIDEDAIDEDAIAPDGAGDDADDDASEDPGRDTRPRPSSDTAAPDGDDGPPELPDWWTDDGGDDGGCAATPTGSASGWWLLIAALVIRRRRA